MLAAVFLVVKAAILRVGELPKRHPLAREAPRRRPTFPFLLIAGRSRRLRSANWKIRVNELPRTTRGAQT
jgi:hypothetical protein